MTSICVYCASFGVVDVLAEAEEVGATLVVIVADVWSAIPCCEVPALEDGVLVGGVEFPDEVDGEAIGLEEGPFTEVGA